MMQLRPSEARGHANFGWLDSRHSFSFGNYHDPAHMGFGPLRVINEDRVAPAAGFDTHGHADMEIVSYVLDGALEHKDSLGTGSVIRPGDVQRMSAGTGVKHSEFNASKTDAVHFLQIWIIPEARGIEPSYEQRHFPQAERRNALRLVASGTPRDGALKIHQHADIHASLLDAGQQLTFAPEPGRRQWLQLAAGELVVNGEQLRRGDGLAITDEPSIRIEALDASEFLLFDMA
ncbi:MAG: pirin family protein [Anderseniella sp.]|jgi:redox-sensitive bicupin YhaK (pirin superfamily)|nr:pirin family protein [Anderseniella sp.]